MKESKLTISENKSENGIILKLALGVIAGIAIGLISNREFMVFLVTIKALLGQVIMFSIPLIIIGFVAPAITKLKDNASNLLALSLVLAYVSSVSAAFLSSIAGYTIIPHLNVTSQTEGLKELPKVFFELNIPQIMPVISALFFAILLGLAVVWTKSKGIENLLDEFQNIILSIVNRVVIPLLPLFISTTFASLAYEGSITKQIPVFISVILIVLVGHFIWLLVLYTIAGIYSKKNPIEVIKHYLPAYLTAVGTMSSAATMSVALNCARKSKVLRKTSIDFGIPLFSNIHLCGSVLTEVFFVMVVSQILYGKLPDMSSMIVFILLLGVFAIGAPGVPGGTVVASLGIIISILGFDDTGTALMMTIFALQDSFGTACNVVGDGALTLILSKYEEDNSINRYQNKSVEQSTTV